MISPQNPDYVSTPVSPDRPICFYQRGERPGQPAVSIITPTFNTGTIFEETIACVQSQSLQNYEWIIVDDGSTETRFLARLSALQAQDPRVRVIRQTNRGPSAARNRAVEEARTEFIFQIDSDDLVEPTFCEKCLWALESSPQYAFCNSHAVGFGERTYLWPVGYERGRDFLQENLVSPQAVIRRIAHLEVGGYDESIRQGHEDWDYWLSLAGGGHWGYTIPEYLIWYRWTKGSRIWETLEYSARHDEFRAFLHRKHARLLRGPFPEPQPRPTASFQPVCDELPYQNPIGKPPGRRRLLMLVPWLTMGGADKFNLDLVEQLSKRQYEITICTTREGDNAWLPKFARFTPDIFVLPHFLRSPDYPRFLRYVVESRHVDLVLTSNSELGYQLLPYLRSRCPDVTFVDYNHIVEEYWKNGGHPRSAVSYQELLDLNIVSNQNLKEWMVSKGADAGGIEVCYTNVDPDRWDPVGYSRSETRRGLAVPEEVPLLLYAGRLCEQKRPRFFAKVMLELARQDLDFVCLVAGDGEERRFLEFFVWRHRLGKRVRLLGEVGNERMRELMAAADIFFLPSQWEGIAVTLFEAMAMEVVPVAADVGGQSELVTAHCGFLIPQSENELQEYVSVLKELMGPPDLRVSMGAAGRQRIVEHFTSDQMGERMVALFSKAQELASTSPRPAVGKGLGLESATLAIEYARLDGQAEELKSLGPVRRSRFWRLGQRAVDTLPGWLIYEAVHAIARRLVHRQGRYWQSEYEDLDTNI